jgi:hypothetical protein
MATAQDFACKYCQKKKRNAAVMIKTATLQFVTDKLVGEKRKQQADNNSNKQ